MTITFKGGIIASGEIKAEVNIAPIWTTIAGTVGSFEELTEPNFQFNATDPEGGSLIYSLISGSLPAGLSLSSSGLLSGTASDVESDTTSGFTLRVTDEGELFQDRTFSMEITDVPPIPNMWSWGVGYAGGTGHGDIINKSSPVAIGSSQTWSKINTNRYHTFAIESDGSLFAWGHNDGGQLGLEDAINKSSPVQIGNLTDWANISGGVGAIAHAIKTDGTLWSWGNGANGNTGHSDTITRSSPVQVGSLTDWSSVVSGSLAIKTDGTLWSWGVGTKGVTGHGDTIARSSPVQVGSLTDWASITSGSGHSLAIKTNGTLWSWGRNELGQLGHGDTVNRSSPSQIGSLTNWTAINSSGDHTIALNSLGEIWAWGVNLTGGLGLEDTINRSSPIQIGTLTDWSIVTAGFGGHSAAIKTDGTLWAWGKNHRGQLGQYNIINYSSPVQVGSLTDWVAVDLGGGASFGLRDTTS